MLTLHSSRSRYEAYMKCSRMGYLQYNYQGKGIVRQSKSIFLITGNWLHKGLELIGKDIQKRKAKAIQADTLEWIIAEIKKGYFAEVFPKNWEIEGGGFNLNDEIEEEGVKRQLTEHEYSQLQQYTFNEQTALIEGFLRVFCIRILPRWMEQYRITAIEKDLSFPLVSGEGFEVIQQARIDWVIQDISTKDLFLVNFKGYKYYGQNEAKAASHDTQGLSESWAFDEFLKEKGFNKRIMGVKMVYFIKGDRKDYQVPGRYDQQNSLVRGWRKLTEEGPVYAHSYRYPNSNNASGWGMIGKAYEPFKVFEGEGLEEVGGVKGWVEMLASGEVQPECGDALDQLIVEPEAWMREQQDIDEWLLETVCKEKEIARKLIELENKQQEEGELFTGLAIRFPKNRAACHYYPGSHNDCPYIPICHGSDEEREKPLENGFQWREPHHEAEKLYQIKGEK